MISSVRVSVPATVANVACGFDVLGFALHEPQDILHLKKIDDPKIQIINQTPYDTIPLEPTLNCAGQAILTLMRQHKIPHGFQLTLEKKIKPGSGIGSSAASAVAAVVGANALLANGFQEKELLAAAKQGEKVASKALHLDNVAPALRGGMQLVRDHRSLDVISLPIPKGMHGVVIHPELKIETAFSRSLLPSRIPLQRGIAQWANMGALVVGLYREDWELIARALKDKVAEPHRKKLIPGYQAVKEAALGAGAAGCNISGSGPSIFALCSSREIALRVSSQMKAVFDEKGIRSHAYVSPINQTGPQILPEFEPSKLALS